jgi:hypothetical protein
MSGKRLEFESLREGKSQYLCETRVKSHLLSEAREGVFCEAVLLTFLAGS